MNTVNGRTERTDAGGVDARSELVERCREDRGEHRIKLKGAVLALRA